eukprot:7218003-Lingulodinium_polyedra.AAC.1
MRGVLWSIENPRNSILWWCPEMVKISDLKGVRNVHFQACVHGGKRDKWATWTTNVPELQPLAM